MSISMRVFAEPRSGGVGGGGTSSVGGALRLLAALDNGGGDSGAVSYPPSSSSESLASPAALAAMIQGLTLAASAFLSEPDAARANTARNAIEQNDWFGISVLCNT